MSQDNVMKTRERRVKQISWGVAGCLVLIAQGPLFWLLAQGHDRATVIGVIRHAPNQFAFLLVFFPVAAVFGARINIVLHEILEDHQVARKSKTVACLLRWWSYVGVLLLAVLLALGDGLETPADFYSKSHDDVEDAVDLNAKIGADGAPEELLALYQAPEAGWLMRWLEGAELASGVFVGVFLGVACVVGLRLRLLALNDEALQNDLRELAPLMVLAILGFAPWCPLRAHNIAEIRVTMPKYTTVEPIYVLILMVIVVLYSLVIYYKDLRSVAAALKKIWGGVVALGGMSAIVWFTVRPTFLSGMLQRLTMTSLVVVAIAVFLLVFLLSNLLRVEERVTQSTSR